MFVPGHPIKRTLAFAHRIPVEWWLGIEMNEHAKLGRGDNGANDRIRVTLSQPQTVGVQIVENNLVLPQFDHTEEARWLSDGVNGLRNFG